MEKKFSYKTFAQRRVAEGKAFLTSLLVNFEMNFNKINAKRL